MQKIFLVVFSSVRSDIFVERKTTRPLLSLNPIGRHIGDIFMYYALCKHVAPTELLGMGYHRVSYKYAAPPELREFVTERFTATIFLKNTNFSKERIDR